MNNLSQKLKILITAILSFYIFSANGQNTEFDKRCRIIEFINKDSINSISKLTPLYNKRGFYLLQNGVYDFVIDGKKYFQSLILKIEKDRFFITKNWQSEENNEIISDSIEVLINQEIQVRMVSIDKGVGNLPTRTNLKKYNVTIIPNENYCSLKNIEIISKEKTYLGHYYFTERGLKKIKIIKNTPYLCEENGEFILRRN
ncbi:hypothetical protein [Flavobacterium pectinovorum]|uniref:Uncharacterized protein n=1 Tax=Flavobacterium pectinovorum TaxID=29533 RepID=A0AB36P0I6_9FLAO|nr:hypothetical protein [Flavobacterium pectinovorum]OXB04675.1 hypothetical protein B0A72_11905 [Flavobacterium pectinovorum]SHL26580.1 hypothetical protein SAMN05444387_0176 [Flavobacterium pectinovorum]